MRASIRPLITWVGGKQRLADEIIARMRKATPMDKATRLVEPFCGPFGFTCSFAAQFPRVSIYASDRQALLVSLARAVQNTPNRLAADLEELSKQWVAQPDKESKKRWFYALRDSFNQHLHGHRILPNADAVFMAIMRTGYTGLLRFNRDGLINTPAGHCKDKPIEDTDRILEFSQAIRGWSLSCRSYEDSIADVKPGSVVYLDPPYRETYNDYTAGGFNEDGLPDYMRECIARGALLVVMSQSWHEEHWRRVLPDAELQSIERRQGVNADAGEKGRPLVREALLIMRGKQ